MAAGVSSDSQPRGEKGEEKKGGKEGRKGWSFVLVTSYFVLEICIYVLGC